MDYQALYQQKLTTAAEAVKAVKSGDWVDYTWCTNHPVALDRALAARKDELYDVKVRGGVTMWMPETTSPGSPGTAAGWTGRLSPRGWAFSAPCATPSCPGSTGSTWTRWMW